MAAYPDIDKLVDEAEDDLDRQDVAVPRSLSQPGVDLKPSARSARSGMERVDVRLSERQQLHAFKGWFNAHLFKRGLKVESLAEGIASVVPLIHLLEILSDDKIPGIVKQHKKPRHKFDRMAALHLCLDFVNSRSRRRVDLSYDKSRLLSAKDVKLSLALAWRIILTFQQAETGLRLETGITSPKSKSKTASVVSWVNATLQEADSGSVEIRNLTTDFLDGSVLVELLNLAVSDDDDRIIKEEFEEMVRTDMAHLEPRAGLLTALLQHGEEFCDLPQMIIVEDFLKNPDERSMLAYLSILKERVAEVREEKRIAAERAVMSPTGALRIALFETVETVETVEEDFLSPMEAMRLKEDVEFLKSKTVTSEMELEMTKGTLAKVRDTMEEDRGGFAAERIALQREADALRSKATKSAAERDSANAERERLRQELKDMDAKFGMRDFAPEAAAERETWFTQKISKMEAFMEEQKQKFTETVNEQKEKLTRSNEAGRDYREKFRTATDDCQRAADALTEAHSELAVKESAVGTLEERVDILKAELSSEILKSSAQMKELQQCVRELKRKEEAAAVALAKPSPAQVVSEVMEEAAVESKDEAAVGAIVDGGSVAKVDTSGSGKVEAVEADSDAKEEAAAEGVDSGKFWMTEAARKLVKESRVNPFHQKVDLKKTRMGSDKAKAVWNFLGTDGNIHVVGLKHSYSSSAVQKGSKTKKTLVVDGRQTLSKKTADRQLHFAVAKDTLLLGFVPDKARAVYRYVLLINGQSHEDMSAEYSSKRRPSLDFTKRKMVESTVEEKQAEDAITIFTENMEII